MSSFVLRILLAAAVVFLLCDVYYLHLKAEPSITFPPPPRVEPLGTPWPQRQRCPFSPSPLGFIDSLTPRNYTRGVIRPRFTQGPKPALGRIEDQLLPSFIAQSNVLSRKYATVKENCSDTVIAYVDVEPDPSPYTGKNGTGSILFGVATTIQRIEKALPRFTYLIGGAQASMLALVPPEENLEEKERDFRARGIDIVLQPSKLDFTYRYVSLVRALSSHMSKHRPKTQWVSLIDDDTFFPSLSLVSDRLSTLSPSTPHWIGALSEASWQVKTFGHFSFGGAGVILSRSLVQTLDERYDDCAGERLGGSEMTGDQRLGKCINKVLPLQRLTVWDELHQWDMGPEPHGLFESGRPIWSFHHFSGRDWGSAEVLGMSAVTTVAGEKSILRRWVFDLKGSGQGEDRDFWVLTNGYSILRYHVKAGTPDIDFARTEHTWPEEASGYKKSLGTLRSAQQDGVTKQRWLLRDAVKVGANLHQFYLYQDAAENSIIEMVWLGVDPNSGALLE